MNARITLVGLILWTVVGVTAQQPKSVAKQQAKPSAEEEKRTAELQSFINYAQSIPPEFSADLLLQVVESGAIRSSKRKRDLTVEAFYVAAKAKEPVKLGALPGTVADSRAGYRANALRLGLDKLSLQVRAIKALLPLDKRKARQLFDEIKLETNPLSCEQPLAYNVEAFFAAVEAIAQNAFSAEETARGEHIQFVENHISKINSSSQVQPAVKTILAITANDLELMSLGRAFSGALQKIPSDDRSFSAPWNLTLSSLDQLVTKFNQRQLASDEIVESYRVYLVKQLGGSRCADTASKKQQELESQTVTHFNEQLRSRSYKKIAPISEDEIKPAKREGRINDHAYWASAKSKSLLSRIKKLRFNAAGKEFDDRDKQGADWQSQLSEIVRELAAWGAEDEESEEDYFHQKSVVYQALLRSIPSDNQYEGVVDEALRDFAGMLSSSALQKEKPAEWYLHAKVLIDRVINAKPAEREKLTNLINSSRSAVLPLYLQKQQLLPTSRQAPTPRETHQ